jgi:predicted dehydrogenase
MNEYPSNIHAMANIGDTQVDENTLVTMAFPSGGYAQFTCTIMAEASNSMTILGNKGKIILPSFFWNGTKAILQQQDTIVEDLDFPHKINGFEYQIEESMRCLEAGKKFSSMMPHADSLKVMQVMDEIRQQIGLKYSEQLEAL